MLVSLPPFFLVFHKSAGDQCDARVMDFGKSLDQVSHARLIKELEFVGIRGQILMWIQCFRSDLQSSH